MKSKKSLAVHSEFSVQRRRTQKRRSRKHAGETRKKRLPNFVASRFCIPDAQSGGIYGSVNSKQSEE